jgi:hypothetical protein
MLTSRPSPLLRQALLADAVLSGATGLLMLLGAGFLAGLLDLPEALLRYAGLALVPYVAFVAYVATRKPISRAAVWVVIVANDLWAAASVALLLTGWLTPNALGTGFVLFQALVVAALSAVQFVAVRRSAAAAA